MTLCFLADSRSTTHFHHGTTTQWSMFERKNPLWVRYDSDATLPTIKSFYCCEVAHLWQLRSCSWQLCAWETSCCPVSATAAIFPRRQFLQRSRFIRIPRGDDSSLSSSVPKGGGSHHPPKHIIVFTLHFKKLLTLKIIPQWNSIFLPQALSWTSWSELYYYSVYRSQP